MTQINDLWYTPPEIIACVDAFFGKEKWFDPCPVKPKFNGLAVDWKANCFINPPYSRELKAAFIKKAFQEIRPLYTHLWLVNYANSLDCKDLAVNASAVIIPEKRIRFIPGHPDLGDGKSPRYDSVFYLWGNPEGLQEAFKSVGKVFEV